MRWLKLEDLGGQDAPYVFVRFPGRDSWDVFKEIMEKVQVRHRPFFRKTLVVALPVVAVALHSSEFAVMSAA